MNPKNFLTSTLLLGYLAVTMPENMAIAQVRPDVTLGPENSVVNSVGNGGTTTYTITGGASRGVNLFHSFEQFTIPTGGTAFFANADTVANIISRVTGAGVSNLGGTIRANGNANLFLINPAGIMIGPEARLDIGGSFFASTGQSLRFENNFVYDAVAGEAPPLLTVSAPIGLLMGDQPGSIQVRGQSNTTVTNAAVTNSVIPNFAVAPNQTLMLVGGEILLTGAHLTAPGGRIALGSIQETSEIRLNATSQGVEADLTSVSSLGNIQILDQSSLNVSGPGGGNIQIQGQDLTLANQSTLISDTLGNIDGGVIRIMVNRFSLQDSAFIGAATVGEGSGSKVEITANQEISLLGQDIINFKLLQIIILNGLRQLSDRESGGIFTTTTSTGQAGDIILNTGSLLVDQGITISTESLGIGNSGDIEVVASENVQLRGSGFLANSLVPGVLLIAPGGIATGLSTIGIPAGNAGDITVNTPLLLLEDGAGLATSTVSDRKSGNIMINAPESITLRGFFEPIPFPSSITNTTIGGNGDAGNIQIETGRLILQDGAEIFSNSGTPAFQGVVPFGGAAGNLFIRATESIEIMGSVFTPSFSGEALVEAVPSNIESATFSEAPAGRIHLTTPQLTVKDGGRITSATFGPGTGGTVEINADTITLAGTGGRDNEIISGIFSNSGTSAQDGILSGGQFLTDNVESPAATGSSGAVEINTNSLNIRDFAEISVGSFDLGAAGSLRINADVVRLDNQGELTATTVTDQGGNINLTSNVLILDNSRISTTSRSGDGGNLIFNLRDLLILRNESLVSTEAGTTGTGGNGGDITLNLPNGFIVAVPTENSDIRANAFEGNGGNVNIAARSLLGIAFRPEVLDTPLSDITSSSQFGNSGTVTIDELNPDVLQSELELPIDTAPSTLAQGCRAQGSRTSSFVSTGRGGLPMNPSDPLSDHTIWEDLAPLSLSSDVVTIPMSLENITDNNEISHESVVEAQTWTRKEDGTVMLLAQQTERPDRFLQANGCQNQGD